MIATQKEIAKVDSLLLSEFILFKYGPMSHLKLQKLLFYAQALHLAYFDEPIIEDDFEAWVHGPVSRKVFGKVKGQSILYNEIKYEPDPVKPLPDVLLREALTGEQIQLVSDILDEYSKMSSLELENLTHSEQPWQEARKGLGQAEICDKPIPKESIRAFYKSLLYEEN